MFFPYAYDKISQPGAMPKIILKLQNGEEKTGEVLLFNINKPTFQMQADRGDGTKKTLTIRMETIKAVLFLKKDEGGGTRLRTETIDQSIYAGTMAFRLVVEFQDGEVINGSTLKYDRNDKGFFLVPINPADMSERIYVNAQAAKNVDCKKLLGKILVDQNKITHGQLAESLKYQQEQREKKGKDTIVVATSQPQDSEAPGVLSKLTSLNVELVVAYEGYITSAINAHFPPKEPSVSVT